MRRIIITVKNSTNKFITTSVYIQTYYIVKDYNGNKISYCFLSVCLFEKVNF